MAQLSSLLLSLLAATAVSSLETFKIETSHRTLTSMDSDAMTVDEPVPLTALPRLFECELASDILKECESLLVLKLACICLSLYSDNFIGMQPNGQRGRYSVQYGPADDIDGLALLIEVCSFMPQALPRLLQHVPTIGPARLLSPMKIVVPSDVYIAMAGSDSGVELTRRVEKTVAAMRSALSAAYVTFGSAQHLRVSYSRQGDLLGVPLVYLRGDAIGKQLRRFGEWETVQTRLLQVRYWHMLSHMLTKWWYTAGVVHGSIL